MFLDIDYWLRYVIIIIKKDWEVHMVVLLAGGAGYIGSHTAVELLNAGIYKESGRDNWKKYCIL